MIVLDSIHGVLETIGGITWPKWRPILDTAAPIQTVTIRIFAATTMSTNGKNAKKMSAGTYCSDRAAIHVILSRRPISTFSTIAATSGAVGIRPSLAPIASTALESCVPGIARHTTSEMRKPT